jgi:hypothetical protein
MARARLPGRLPEKTKENQGATGIFPGRLGSWRISRDGKNMQNQRHAVNSAQKKIFCRGFPGFLFLYEAFPSEAFMRSTRGGDQ